MRDVAEAAHVALATVLKMEAGVRVSHRTEQRVQAAFQAQGVKSWRERGGTSVLILDQAPTPPKTAADELRAIPWVSVWALTGGRHKVEFRVPSLHRPDRWPPAQRLPVRGTWPGNLDDPSELAAIKRDALTLGAQLAKMTELEGSPASRKRGPRTQSPLGHGKSGMGHSVGFFGTGAHPASKGAPRALNQAFPGPGLFRD